MTKMKQLEEINNRMKYLSIWQSKLYVNERAAFVIALTSNAMYWRMFEESPEHVFLLFLEGWMARSGQLLKEMGAESASPLASINGH